MKILDKLFNVHENYLERVKKEREKVKDWSEDKLNSYVDSYFNYGFSSVRSFFGETIFGEPARIEACIEVSGQKITDRLYKPK